MQTPLVSVENLCLDYKVPGGLLQIFRDLNLNMYPGEILGIAGESGCGKSTLAYAIANLLPKNAVIRSGRVIFDGDSILECSEHDMRKIRGKKITMVFQDPMTSLNPLFTVEQQLGYVINTHLGLEKEESTRKSLELLRMVELPHPEGVLKSYPYELSGGMQQRVMIAMAISTNPKLIIADEPTTAVDATIQAQLLDLLLGLKKKVNLSILFITHNLDLVAEVCDRAVIIYAGDIVESGPAAEVIKSPKHPYVQDLVASIPHIDNIITRRARKPLSSIPGSLPDMTNPPPGCKYYNRCKSATEKCGREKPILNEIGKNHICSCLYLGD